MKKKSLIDSAVEFALSGGHFNDASEAGLLGASSSLGRHGACESALLLDLLDDPLLHHRHLAGIEFGLMLHPGLDGGCVCVGS